MLTILTDGCTDFLFDKADPQPKYVFRITNIQSADGITAAIGVAQTWPQVRKIAHIHPDYSYGRNAAEHFTLALERLVPGTEVVSESWPKLGTTDFTAHITKIMSAQPDLLISSVWGGDYVAFYKQALRYGLFDKMKVASTIAFGVAPHAIGKDHPEGVLAGVHSNYHFTYPARRPLAGEQEFRRALLQALERIPELPVGRGLYLALPPQVRHRAGQQAGRRLAGGRGDHQPARRPRDGYPGGLSLHAARHTRAYKDAVTGFIKKVPQYSSPSLGPGPDHHHSDPQHHARRSNWPKPGTTHNESTAAANWIKTTWPKAVG